MEERIPKQFGGREVLVTGGTGLIGRQVVKLLCDAGAHVRIVSLDRVTVDERAEHVLGDLTSFDFCKDVTRGMDCVCHLAGIKGSAAVSTGMIATHFVPTLMMNTNVLEACRVNGVQRAVYTSSIGAYASTEVFRESDYRLDSLPMDFAGWAKRVAELQVEAYHTQYGLESFAVVRPSNVYGPGDNFDPDNAMVIPSLMCRIRRGEDPLVVWGDGSAVRDFVYSRDVAEGVVLALCHGTKGGFVNLGSGRECTIRQLIETLNAFLDFRYEFDARKPTGYPKRVMDISLARERLGYDPSTSLLDGLQETWAWYIEHEDEYKNKKNYFLQTA
ncbi:MAG: NAD-dependent epimerase/dehydratase family protein [Sedimentisphaerales bacterium]|jgi:GDP-L-fucose synthase|nr:NAD-dependent epimerase/dehydratase family protein [Sedimentisphaerales bacterium]NLT78608.1 NAD-dependent epimerase/dehydratase family protein [Planctomycetota bacterium]